MHTIDDYAPPPQAVPLLYADAQLLVVDKAAGLLAVPGRGAGMDDCLIARVQQHYPDALIVHRLDMATSGLMVLARSVAVQRQLSMAFAAREVDKHYVALLDGLPVADSGSVALALGADWLQRPRQQVQADGKPALTHYRVLARDHAACRSRVLLMPVTGRTHQLRVHMQALGHPICGDALYGASPAPRLMLHAQMLALAHPLDGRAMQWRLDAPF